MPDNDLVEQWKRFLLTCRDTSFFGIMRNYLGDIKTPFNKHTLIEKLIAFLRKRETRQRIISLIDEEDALLLNAIDELQEPELSRLYALFQSKMPYIELHKRLLNLEERLLVYREELTDRYLIHLNPILHDSLKELIFDSTLLFPVSAHTVKPVEPPWLSDLLLVSFLSFVIRTPLLFKQDGSSRKRSATLLKKRIPLLTDQDRLTSLTESLIFLGLLSASEGKLVPKLEVWKSFANLSPFSRISYICAADILRRNKSPKTQVESTAALCASLLKSLDAQHRYPRDTLARILIAVDTLVSSESDPYIILDTCVTFGLLIPQTGDLVPAYSFEELSDAEDTSVVFQPTFELTVKSNITMDSGLKIALASEIVRHDRAALYEVTKTSYHDLLREAIDSSSFIADIEKMQGRELPQHVAFTLRSWEEEYRSIRLIEGTVLKVDEKRQLLVEHGLQDILGEQIAPGVYFLKTGDYQRIKTELIRSGIESVPAVERLDGAKKESVSETLFREVEYKPLPMTEKSKEKTSAQNDAWQTELRRRAEVSHLEEEEREELMGRFEKKLVLFASQFKSWRSPEKSEARGFDYVGKVRLVEQALACKGDLLEITVKGGEGNLDKLLVEPQEVQKEGNDLTLHCRLLPKGNEEHLKVRAMRRVKRLHSSLFAR